MNRRTPAFEHVVAMYRTWATENPADVWNKRDAWDDLRGDLVDFLRATKSPEDWNNLAEMLFNRADGAIVHAGEKEIKDGEQTDPLALALPYSLDQIIALGGGDRCLFGNMRLNEWSRHDDKKHRNLSAVQDKYNEWRQGSAHLMPGFNRGLTVREIYVEHASGLLEVKAAA